VKKFPPGQEVPFSLFVSLSNLVDKNSCLVVSELEKTKIFVKSRQNGPTEFRKLSKAKEFDGPDQTQYPSRFPFKRTLKPDGPISLIDKILKFE